MKIKFDNLLWGLLLILVGGVVLAQQQGWMGFFSVQMWMVVFAMVSVIFLLRYFISGLRHWGWLFPAGIFAAVATTLYLSENGLQDTWLAAPIFVAIIIPFLVAFFMDIRKNWWALIPAFITLVLCLVVLFGSAIPGELVATLIMFSVAIPFTGVYLSDRQKVWALIPAFTTAMIGVITLLSLFAMRWVGAMVTIAVAIPFFYVYSSNRQNWWAVIPAGIMASIGINVLLSDPTLGKLAQGSLPAALLFLGWSATFGWLWREREKYPTQWARIPALVSGIIGIILLITSFFNNTSLAVDMIVAGLLLIFFGLRPRKENLAKKES